MKHLRPVKSKWKNPKSPDKDSSLLRGDTVNHDEVIHEWSMPPEIWWPQHWFEDLSFSRWAAEELIEEIMSHPTTPAEDTIWLFALKMSAYQAASRDRPAERIFAIAADFANEFLDNIKS